jgi:hypothetical protein
MGSSPAMLAASGNRFCALLRGYDSGFANSRWVVQSQLMTSL